MRENETVWERCWKKEDPVELCAYLERYYQPRSREIELFKAHHIRSVCDAACGYGAHTLAFASHGFEVYGFDISPTAVEIAKRGLAKYGVDPSRIKTVSILETGYADETFDGTVAHSVLDHMTVADAKKALAELLRITRKGGLLLLSFDSPEDGPVPEHVTLADGSLQYTGDSPRQGMILHPYTPEELDAFVKGRQIVYRGENGKGEQVVILRK